MKVRLHVATSMALAGILYWIFKSVPMTIGAFLSGILIDLDHILEGFIDFGGKFNIFQTIKFSEQGKFNTAYLFFHSYEFLLIYVLIASFCHLGAVYFGIAASLTLHIIMDNLTNPFYPNCLFFIKRWREGFVYSKIVEMEKIKRKHSYQQDII